MEIAEQRQVSQARSDVADSHVARKATFPDTGPLKPTEGRT